MGKIRKIFFVVTWISLLYGFDSVDIQCYYRTDYWTTVGNVYQCTLHNTLNIKSRESAVINSTNGSHMSGKSNADVTSFYSRESSRVIEYFPRNLENIFTNLKAVLIYYGRLKEIQQNDLKPFTKLVLLSFYQNDIEFLEDGLFDYNPELEFVGFDDNKIIHIGSNVFKNLNKLAWLYLDNNKCINMKAKNKTEVKELIIQAKSKCSSYSDINKELQILENSLMCINSESLPIFDQNFQNLQNRFQNSTISQYMPLKKRFQTIAAWKSNSTWTVKERLSSVEGFLSNSKSEILNSVSSSKKSINDKIDALESILIKLNNKTTNGTNDQEVFPLKDFFKPIMIVVSAIFGTFNIILIIIIFQKSAS